MAEGHRTTRLSAEEVRRNALMAVAIAVIGLLIAAGLGLTRLANDAAGAVPDVLASAPARSQHLVAVAASPSTLDPAGRAAPAAAGATAAPTTPAGTPSAKAASTGSGGTSSSAPTSPATTSAITSSTGGASTPSGASAGARGTEPGDGAFLDSGAAVAAEVTNGPAAPTFDQALVELSAQERASDQQVRADQADQANTAQEQARRVIDQAKAAKGILAEQGRLTDEKQQAEAAAALLKAQQDALAAGQLSTDSAGIRLPDGTLVRPQADGTWPPSVLARLVRLARASGANGRTVVPLARGSYVVGARFGAVGTWATYHTGLDLSAPIGTPIRAAADGVVVAPVAGDWAGTHVIIAHSDGYTLYAHMLATSVKPGQAVKAGDVIGFVGITGRSFGPHLHFEYYPRSADLTTPYSARDPLVWLASRGVTP